MEGGNFGLVYIKVEIYKIASLLVRLKGLMHRNVCICVLQKEMQGS